MDERGYVKIVDRKKDMILVSGFNVYPNEIEDVVAKLPGVFEVAAVGREGSALRRSGEAVHREEGSVPDRSRRHRFLQGATHRLQAAAHRSSSATSCRRAMSARSCAANCATAAHKPGSQRPKAKKPSCRETARGFFVGPRDGEAQFANQRNKKRRPKAPLRQYRFVRTY